MPYRYFPLNKWSNQEWDYDSMSDDDFDFEELYQERFESWRELMLDLRLCQTHGTPYEETSFYTRDLVARQMHWRHKKLVPVNEWWCPNFLGNLIEVSITLNPFTAPTSRIYVFVRGCDDDCVLRGWSLEKYQRTHEGDYTDLPEVQEAIAMYNRIGAFITKAELRAWGFE